VTARELPRYQSSTYRIDGTEPRAAFLVTFANAAQFGNGVRIAPGARIDDGWLDLVVAEERSRLRTVLNVPRLLAGRIGAAPGVSITRVTEAVIESDTPMLFHVDGEPCEGGTRLEARVVSGALLVAARA
jgi:diacylglycerol kinase family enzyme